MTAVLINGRAPQVVADHLRQLMNRYITAHLPIAFAEMNQFEVGFNWDDFQDLKAGLAQGLFSCQQLNLDEKTLQGIDLAVRKERASWWWHQGLRQEGELQKVSGQTERELVHWLAGTYLTVKEALESADPPAWFVRDRERDNFYNNIQRALSYYRLRHTQNLLSEVRQPATTFLLQELQQTMKEWGIGWRQLRVSRWERLCWWLQSRWRSFW